MKNTIIAVLAIMFCISCAPLQAADKSDTVSSEQYMLDGMRQALIRMANESIAASGLSDEYKSKTDEINKFDTEKEKVKKAAEAEWNALEEKKQNVISQRGDILNNAIDKAGKRKEWDALSEKINALVKKMTPEKK